MDLSEVQKAMVPGAQAAISKALSYDEARQAFLLTLIDVAVQQSDGVQERAARKLSITPAMVNMAINGKALKGKRPGGPRPRIPRANNNTEPLGKAGDEQK